MTYNRACLEVSCGLLLFFGLRRSMRKLAEHIAWVHDVETHVRERRDGLQWEFRLSISGPEDRVVEAAERANTVSRTWEGRRQI